MKNIFKFQISLLFLSVFLISCDKESEGISKVTTFPIITLTGESSIGVALGQPFVDPGYVAKEGDKDITKNVVVKGAVDVSKPGPYLLEYEAVNSDGFKRSATRTVVVYDKSSISTANISGTYVSTIKRTNTTTGASASRGPFSIVITKISDGLFLIDDLLGGWYYYGSSYGVGYAGKGYIVLKANNEIAIAYSTIPSWGDTVGMFATSSYNPATGSISLNTYMKAATQFQFAVTLTK